MQLETHNMPVPQSRKAKVIRNAFLQNLLDELARLNDAEDWHNRNPEIWIEKEEFPGLMFKAVVTLDPKKEDEWKLKLKL